MPAVVQLPARKALTVRTAADVFLDSLDNPNILRSYGIGLGKTAERLGEGRRRHRGPGRLDPPPAPPQRPDTRRRGRHLHPDAAGPLPPRIRPLPGAVRPPRRRLGRPARRQTRPRRPPEALTLSRSAIGGFWAHLDRAPTTTTPPLNSLLRPGGPGTATLLATAHSGHKLSPIDEYATLDYARSPVSHFGQKLVRIPSGPVAEDRNRRCPRVADGSGCTHGECGGGAAASGR